MYIQYLSDLHLEFLPYKFFPHPKADCLVLAGDITNMYNESEKNFHEFLNDIESWNKPVIYVLGNHEYYYSTYKEAINYYSSLNISNLHLLDNSCITIEGVRFIGTTLWSNILESERDDVKKYMNDYCLIRNASIEDTLERHQLAKKFLEGELVIKGPKVVVSHHLPSYQSIHNRYRNSTISSAFSSNLDNMIIRYRPEVWIHGHSHSSCDYSIGHTRIVSNPRGYCSRYGIENEEFSDAQIIEIKV